ncbi:MAG: hypothetical protein CXR30_06105 [Geobacter sp.]|nr:MAG: hypothetical protein CXR30_06105 [Geobacter sp.]
MQERNAVHAMSGRRFFDLIFDLELEIIGQLFELTVNRCCSIFIVRFINGLYRFAGYFVWRKR